ncbi:MAG: hypothetical protein FJY92_05270 [Candidatus Hydrogenedentes bacterium]|nr:hypothetical protein [Candidatus Hydrogenedentota bacterium]
MNYSPTRPTQLHATAMQPLHGATWTPHLAPAPRYKIMFAPLGWVLAHTARCLEIAKELRARGHECVFLGEDPDHPRSRLGLVRDAGFRIVRAKEPDQPYAWDRYEKYGALAAGWDLVHLKNWVPLERIIREQVHAIQRERPHLVVGDASISVSTAAYIAGVPAAGIMNGYASHFLTSRCLYHPALQAYDRLHLAPIRRRAFRGFGVQPVNALRLLRSIPLVSPDLAELYDNPSYFPHYHTVGPIVAEHPAPLPDWYDELGDGRTNIYITMGSTGFLDAFLRRTYDALAKLPYRFVVTTGNQVSDETARRAPANFRLCAYAPGSKLLERCRALIFHGGNGTMYQALSAGVPMLALPSHQEQGIVTGFAVNRGFCIRMHARWFRLSALVRNIEKLIADPVYRESAQRLSSAVRASNGPARAADLFERLAHEAKPAGHAL